MKPKKYYDPACEELARHFLASVDGLSPAEIDANAPELAQEIQNVIEDVLARQARRRPGLPAIP